MGDLLQAPELKKTKEIANLRIHVERAIIKIPYL